VQDSFHFDILICNLRGETMDSRYAQKIINIAKGELGKVSDKDIVYDQMGKATELRKGWENLKGYFEVAGGYSDAHWKMKGFQTDGKEISFLDGVRLRNKRVPQKNTTGGKVEWSGTQWCGIFATWCWIKAGVPQVKWGFPGVKGQKVRIVPDFTKPKMKDLTMSDLSIGDIAVLNDEDPKNRLVHHCIVTNIMGNTFESVNGNSDYQGVLLKTLPRTRINCFYTYKDDFLNILKDMYSNVPEPAAE
jgi:hypothetical protein